MALAAMPKIIAFAITVRPVIHISRKAEVKQICARSIKQTKANTEQHRQAERRVVCGGEQAPADHGEKDHHPQAETAARLLRFLG